jgi:hypothetical protein
MGRFALARVAARPIGGHYALDCRRQPPTRTLLHPLTPTDTAEPRRRRGLGCPRPYIDLRQSYATDRMLIDSDNAGEGKVTKMTRRDGEGESSLCLSRLINIEPSLDAVSNEPAASVTHSRLSGSRESRSSKGTRIISCILYVLWTRPQIMFTASGFCRRHIYRNKMPPVPRFPNTMPTCFIRALAPLHLLDCGDGSAC